MADSAHSALQAIVGKLVEYLVDAFKDQVSYLCCYSRNVPKLAEEVGQLNDTYESVQQYVAARRNNLEIITPVVESWLQRVEGVKRESGRIQNAAEEVGKSSLCKWIPVVHYSLSRDAVNTTESAIQLLRTAPPVPICIPRIAAEIDPVPHPSQEFKFKSRDEIEGKIMDALEDQTVYLIGLHGMGGVGKTTLAKKIEARARKEKLIFQHFVMTTVSQQPNLAKIQNDIAEALGLKLSAEKSLSSRAKILHERLKAEKGLLVILDDVWEILNLVDLGIPSPKNHVGCKLILTSRDKQNFNVIGNPKSEIFELGILEKDESWILFGDNAGDAIDSPDLIEIANDIVKECNGLPLALEVVGRSLRGKSKSYWENARTELRKSMPTNIEGVEQRVYRPLMYSIERLESPDARSLILLCCLFPDDYYISIEELVRYGIGLGIFEEEELMDVRKKVESILDNLISRALLTKCIGRDPLHVQIHDLLRDVGIWIASKKKIESEEGNIPKGKHVFLVSHGKDKWPMREKESYGCYTCISLRFSQKDINILEFMHFPKLEYLQIGLLECWRRFLNIPKNFFSRMGSLRVLEASNFSSLPSSICLLENLRSLCLYDSEMFGAVSMIGKLTNLEILFLECCNIDVLPKEIGGLTKLRQFHITDCTGLRIAFGVISELDQLEDLVILNSFDNWDAQAIEATNASLVELDRLNHLTTLVIEIKNPNIIPRERPHWVRNVKEYRITVSKSANIIPRHLKAITWEYGDITLRDWLCDMVSDADYLDLAGSSCFKAVSSLSQKGLQFLSLSRLTDLQYLAEGQQNGAIFPMLKSLCIEDSCSLLQIFNVPPPVGSLAALEEMELRGLSRLRNVWEFLTENLCLSKLKRLIIHSCEKLGYLFSLSIAQSLSQLKELEVSNCPMMEEVFKKDDGEMKIKKLEFSKLKWLTLESMESLCRFCKGVDRIEISAVNHLKLKNLASIIGTCETGIYQRCLFEQQFAGNFSRLQNLSVENVHKLKYLFSPSILSGFSNLEKLEVENCSELEEIIGKDENVGGITIFPKLKKLKLFNLPKILTFCYTAVELPVLEELHVKQCPIMEGFSQGLSNTTNSRFGLSFFSIEFAGSFSGLQILRMESIHKVKCLFSLSILSGFSNLDELKIEDCSELEVIGTNENVEKKLVFPKLKKLELFNLPKILTFSYINIETPLLKLLHIKSCPMMEEYFQELCDTPDSRFGLSFFRKESAGIFSGLQNLRVESIHNKVKCLFSPSIVSGFANLEELVVEDCSELEEVIGKYENLGETIVFPKLKKLELSDLPKVITFCYTDIELPSQEQLQITSCPLMARFSQTLSDTSNSRLNLPFFNKEVYCPKLEALSLRKLNNIANIFSPHAFRALKNLRTLSVRSCKELKEVIGKEEAEEILSPPLEELDLRDLLKISRFCHMKHWLEFLSLSKVSINNCPMLERFSLGPLHLPNFTRMDGSLDASFAAKFFFDKEISSCQSHLEENNCITISVREISVSFGAYEGSQLEWFLAPSSSESFVDAIAFTRINEWAKIIGNFETTKLIAGVAYEIMLIIMLDEYVSEWAERFEIGLTLSGGITQHCRTEILNKLPKKKWIEISLGNIRREPHQNGQLDFVLDPLGGDRGSSPTLCIKGVKIVKF